jgi:hypothetical protein
MKRQLLLFLFTSFACACSFAQTGFKSYSFDEALQQAGKDGKFVLVLMDTKDCNQCNETATKGFEDKTLGETIPKQFICIRPDADGADWQQLAQQYETPNGLAALFFGSNGTLLHKQTGSSSMGKFYADAATKALSNQSEIMNVESLTQSFSMDNSNIIVLQSLLQKRKELLLSTDSLLDIYVSMLPADSLNSLEQLQYIARFAPVLESKANLSMRRDYDRFNQAWYRMELAERIRINNAIVYKTRQLAIAKKDSRLANSAATFAGSVHSNVNERPKLHTYNMMYYYLGIKDTIRYLSYANMYCTQYLMTVSTDSVARRDSTEKIKAFAAAKPVTTQEGGTSKRFTKTVMFRPVAQYYALELNNIAWNCYTMSPNNPLLLKRALTWAKRANEFFEVSGVMDTYARLLYKTGTPSEAIAWQQKAIALAKKRGYSATEMETVLANMKSGSSTIDKY